jgi:hypothetical protein
VAKQRDNMTLPGERQPCWRTPENPASYQTTVSKHHMSPGIYFDVPNDVRLYSGRPFQFPSSSAMIEQLSTVSGTLTLGHTRQAADDDVAEIRLKVAVSCFLIDRFSVVRWIL